jgi:hypothetical protein
MENNYSDFTRLMLARMESNPDEFSENGRWSNLTLGLQELAQGRPDHYARSLWSLNAEELAALITVYKRVYTDDMHKRSLRRIIEGEPPMPGVDFAQGLTTHTNVIKQRPLMSGFSDPRVAFGSADPKPEGRLISSSDLRDSARSALNTAFNDVYSNRVGYDNGTSS